jgi:hypothetical protein
MTDTAGGSKRGEDLFAGDYDAAVAELEQLEREARIERGKSR